MSTRSKDISLLIARLIIGYIFITAGWMKISAIAQTIGYFSAMGIPAFLAYVVGYAEFIGGILVVVGFWTEISALVLSIIMVVAVYFTIGLGAQFFSTPLVAFAVLILLAVSGAGKYSISSCKKGGTCEVK